METKLKCYKCNRKYNRAVEFVYGVSDKDLICRKCYGFKKLNKEVI